MASRSELNRTRKADLVDTLASLDEETVVMSRILAVIPANYDARRGWSDSENNARARRIRRILTYVAERNGVAL